MDKTVGNKREDITKRGRNLLTKDRGTANTKSIGLDDDLIAKIEQYPDLYPLLRLHDLNKKVRAKSLENSDKIDKLKMAF